MTGPGCDRFEELAALQALDALDAADVSQVDAHLASCPACREAAAAMRETVGVLAYGAAARPLRPEVKGRLMQRIGPAAAPAAPRPADPGMRPGQPAPVPARMGNERALAACALVLAIGLGGSLAQLGHVQAELSKAESRVAALSVERASLLAQAARRSTQATVVAEDADFLASKDVRMVQMEPQPTAQDAQAWVYWSPTHHAWLVTFRGLPAAGPSKTYQLWAVTADTKMSLGTFKADRHGVARVRVTLPPGDKPVAAAVTLEPAGGMPQPTGPMVMVGPIKHL